MYMYIKTRSHAFLLHSFLPHILSNSLSQNFPLLSHPSSLKFHLSSFDQHFPIQLTPYMTCPCMNCVFVFNPIHVVFNPIHPRPTGAGRHGVSSSWARSERSSGETVESRHHHDHPHLSTKPCNTDTM